ncbi:uncharacterized protein Ptth [Fopius arisanus]|uniref:Uncharacterized protein Ptth n=1 Tax=Fopius arisanus TaxID=64838 RepID=A0A9R1U6Y3_9HYME|nr:PREDICTED: uncharacterized protein LOC105270360 [Fopius arisanus]
MKSFTIYIALVNLAIITDGRQFNFDQWSKMIDPDDSLGFPDDCITQSCNDLYEEKRSRGFEGTNQMMAATGPYHFSIDPWEWMSCPCETAYIIEDLGSGHYPRYLSRAHCVHKTCRNRLNPCKLLDYKVHILEERDPNEPNDGQYIEQAVLPEPLRVQWQMKPVTIAVACVAVTERRKN